MVIPTYQIHPADALRNPKSALLPDLRSTMFGALEEPTFDMHHQDIHAIQLSSSVPEAVAIHFETARNLCLYAWFVYRFYMVSEAQALSALEFGLRERLPSTLPIKYHKNQDAPPMLAGMLRYVIDQKLVRNEGFRRWHQAAELRAKERETDETIQMMIEQNLTSLERDSSRPPKIKPEDQHWDFVEYLKKGLPSRRNTLAHGSSMLSRNALSTLEIVAETLNQLFPVSGTVGNKGA
ncbi:hypothetical protein [Hydrogenophaga sp. OTU3427]|uniref:hypothetical protein n=1 Tax=Hydrogenophaga sp. OTU3427 TaxID=3043856 RepID=UPI00313C12F4